MRKIFYVVQKEFRQIRRTKAYFALIFVAPFLQLLIMGSALTTDVKHVPLSIVDHDGSPMSREVIEAAAATQSFDFLGMASSDAQATALLDEGKARIALLVPPHFERDVKDGRAPAVQVLVDGVDGNSAGVALGYMTALLAQVQARWAGSLSSASSLAEQGTGLIAVVPRMWYNANLDSKLNFVPGLAGILLIIVTTFLTAINIVREKEIGTLEQIMVTPLNGLQLMIGKIIPYTILGFAQLTVSILAAGLVFGIWMKGSLLLFYAMAFIFCFSTLGLGIFVSTLARTQQQAMFIGWFFMIFMMLLSGFFIPIDNMPAWVQYLTYINPLRYFILILREIYLKGTGLGYLWKEAAMMGAIGAVALVSATMRFQKRLK
jgi:ABC-2 type transport system permease protein